MGRRDDRHQPQRDALPSKRLIVDRDAGRGREEVVIRVGVIENRAIPPEVLSASEVAHLRCRDRHFGTQPDEGRRSVALVAMEVRVEHPLDLRDAQLVEHLRRQAHPTVDQDRSSALLEHIDVADVLHEVEVCTQLT